MSQYFIDKLVYNNDTLDIHDTEAREMIANNTTNIQAVSARVTKNANDIDALEEITTDIREDVDSLDDRMGVAETEIDGLKTRTTNLEGRMNTAEGRLDGHDTKISDLEDRMDTAEDNITALDGRMTTAEKDIDKLEGRVDLVEDKNDEQDIAIDSLEENVAKNTADIVDIKDDLTGVHENLEDLDDRITASTYEAGIGIYFGQGVEHTNINVEDEILDQINQNTIDIQNLKTRVTNVENRLTTVEGDITNIKADIVNIKSDITSIQNDITNIRGDITTINNKITQIENDINALNVRITALEAKTLPAGGAAGQYLRKRSATDYDAYWGDVDPYEYFNNDNISQYSYPGAVNYKCIIENSRSGDLDISAFSDLIPLSKIPRGSRVVIEQLVFGTGNTIVYATVFPSALVASNYFKLVRNNNGMWSLLENTPITVGNISSDGTTFTPTAFGATSLFYQLFDPNTGINIGYNTEPVLKISIPNAREVYDAFYNHQNGDIILHGIYSNITVANPVIKAFDIVTNPLTGTLVSFTTKDISFT